MSEDKLLLAIRSHETNEDLLTELAKTCDNLNSVIGVEYRDYDCKMDVKYNTTYLTSAIISHNITAVKILLECGADPNFIDKRLFYSDCPPLYSLSIFTGETAEDAKKELIITKLLLDYGADPNLIIPDNNQSVFAYAKETSKMAYDPSSDYDYSYDSAFYELLEAKVSGELDELDMQSLLASFDK